MSVEQPPKQIELVNLLHFMVKEGCSDLHICAGLPPMVRKDGNLIKLNVDRLSPEATKAMAFGVMNKDQQEEFTKQKQLDFSFGVPKLARFRANVFIQRDTISSVYRMIPIDIRPFETSGLPQVTADLCKSGNGIILVTGPTGSGKSTTLATLIDFINKNSPHHILTLEDPVEFIHQSKKSLVSQRELGTHFHTFNDALKAALRQDPDVILIGEMRDAETIELALKAAETGHLVFSTLHTNSCSQTISRIIDTFPQEQQDPVRTQLAMMLKGVLSQNLLPKKGGGRCLALEIMVGTKPIQSLVRENKIHQIDNAIQMGRKDGMQTLNQCILDLYHGGNITREVAIEYSNKDDDITQYMMA